jgi:hypothetical protein
MRNTLVTIAKKDTSLFRLTQIRENFKTPRNFQYNH